MAPGARRRDFAERHGVDGDRDHAVGLVGAGRPTMTRTWGRQRPRVPVSPSAVPGTVDDWPVSVDGPVDTVAVEGDTVYLGGDFRHVDGKPRVSLAALSLSTGALQAWAPSANVSVRAIAVIGSNVAIGGAFDLVTDGGGSTTAPHLARISTAGTVDRAWSTTLVIDDIVRGLLPTRPPSPTSTGR